MRFSVRDVHIWFDAGEFEESKHPRNHGKFSSKSEGSNGNTAHQVPHHDNDFTDTGKLNPKELKQGFRYITELPFPGDTKIQHILDALEKNNPEWKLDFSELKPQKVDVPNLVSMQPQLDEKTMAHYENAGPEFNEHMEKNAAPIVIEYGGKFYLRNGTHRTVAAIRNGETSIEARVIKADPRTK